MCLEREKVVLIDKCSTRMEACVWRSNHHVAESETFLIECLQDAKREDK